MDNELNNRVSKLESGLADTQKDVAVMTEDLKNIKEDVKGIKDHQASTDSSMNELTILFKTFFSKQDLTNDYMKENLNYLKTLYEEEKKKNEDRYIELIKQNSKQDVENKQDKIGELKDKTSFNRDTWVKVAMALFSAFLGFMSSRFIK